MEQYIEPTEAALAAFRDVTAANTRLIMLDGRFFEEKRDD